MHLHTLLLLLCLATACAYDAVGSACVDILAAAQKLQGVKHKHAHTVLRLAEMLKCSP